MLRIKELPGLYHSLETHGMNTRKKEMETRHFFHAIRVSNLKEIKHACGQWPFTQHWKSDALNPTLTVQTHSLTYITTAHLTHFPVLTRVQDTSYQSCSQARIHSINTDQILSQARDTK